MTGRELAIHQALDAFALFTGREAPAEAMARALGQICLSKNVPGVIA
jgi:shikimate dehydrogenase